MKQTVTKLLLTALMATAIPSLAWATDVDGAGDCTKNIRDYGDAPEGYPAYGGASPIGCFPTCLTSTGPGSLSAACAPISTFPGATGFVRHDQSPALAPNYWLGCGTLPTDDGIDTDTDGKTSPGGGASICNGAPTDCAVVAFGGFVFGQDECYGGSDAAIASPITFTSCMSSSVTFTTFNCGPSRNVVLNILVDWNHDGDWNDNGSCPGTAACWYEWSVKNVPIVLPSGCSTITSPTFMAGDTGGHAWLRITISDTPVPDDFPWNGSAGVPPGQSLRGGETEDYPVAVAHIPGPCDASYDDFGDAPEQEKAYSSGLLGRFPTCIYPSIPGTQSSDCAPISSPPLTTGYVHHVMVPALAPYFWLGCGDTAIPHPGIDTEPDGKINTVGAGSGSTCAATVLTDCAEPAFVGPITFGQDECYGEADAGIASSITFLACTPSQVEFETYSCAGFERDVFLNVLVDWNEDGDWNDNMFCPGGACTYEWALKNVPIVIPPGCGTQLSPSFMAGPNPGEGWLRISLTEAPVPDDYPWNGSVSLPGEAFRNGETEDYPVTIRPVPFDPCADFYLDFGDAPEDPPGLPDIFAYPGGALGHFPTCTFPGTPGTQETACLPALSSPPAATGAVIHEAPAGDPVRYWLGCGPVGGGPGGVDSEGNGKMNLSGVVGDLSSCDPGVATDCVEPAFGGATYGQDECYGDGVDAGVAAPIVFTACSAGSVSFQAYNCGAPVEVYLNVLVDWNEDGDWNDNFTCPPGCAYEWAVKNKLITLPPGCSPQVSPSFLAGPLAGRGWLRITLTSAPVPDDYPWNGSLGTVTGRFHRGETEDYPVTIEAPDPCAIEYRDFGDAPEAIAAYPTGLIGHFPTCLAPTAPGTMAPGCAPPLGTPPGATGYVMHLASVTDPVHVWLGCGTPPPLTGVDSEGDGKVMLGASGCAAIPTDCAEPAFGGAMVFAQDECYGDVVDAGLLAPVSFRACTLNVIRTRVANCTPTHVTAYLNVLVDWTQDGDWNDQDRCLPTGDCVHEWAVKNAPITLVPGCNVVVSPEFLAGLRLGPSWMRVTVTLGPIGNDDFPWNGSAALAGGAYLGGETEDYPVMIETSTVVAVDDRAMPKDLQLAIQPNPSWDGANVHFALPREGPVRVAVYDIAGRKLRDLASGTLPAGNHVVRWNYATDEGREASVGLYLVRFEALGRTLTRTAVRVR